MAGGYRDYFARYEGWSVRNSSPHLVAVGWVLYGLLFGAVSLLRDGLIPGPDAGKYLLEGRLTTSGRPTYLYHFEPKPPGNVLAGSVFHLLPGGPVAAYLASVIAMILVVAVTMGLVAWFVLSYTDSPVAAVAAAATPLAIDVYGSGFLHGYMGKLLVPGLVLGGLWLVKRERPLAGIGLGTVAPTLWQFAAPLTLLVWAVATAESDQPYRIGAIGIVVGGCLAVVVVVPFVLLGAGGQLFVQTIVIPLVVITDGSGTRLYFLLSYLDDWQHGLPLVWLGLAGWLLLGFEYRARSDHAALALVGASAWLLLFGPLLGQGAELDMLVLAPFIALGVGVVVGIVPSVPLHNVRETLPAIRADTATFGFIVVVVAISWAWWAFFPPYPAPGSATGQAYINGITPTSCVDHTNLVGQTYAESVPWTPGERCASVSRVLAWLIG